MHQQEWIQLQTTADIKETKAYTTWLTVLVGMGGSKQGPTGVSVSEELVQAPVVKT